MDALTHNPLNLEFYECTDVDVIGFANGGQRLVNLGVKLGSNVFAIECHLGSGLIAEIGGELFNMTYAWILNFTTRDFLNGTDRHAASLSYMRPGSFRVLQRR